MYWENYKTLKKEIEEVINKWKHIPYSWLGEINKTIPFTIASENKIPRNKCNQGCKDLYSENHKKLKKLRKIQKKNESIYCTHEWDELPSLKCPYYPKQSIDSMQFLLKYPVSYTHLTLPTSLAECRSRWSPYH